MLAQLNTILVILFVQISDDDEGFPLSMFTIPAHYVDDLDRVLIPSGLISNRLVFINFCYL